MTPADPVRSHGLARVAGAVLLAGHGLVHLMGVALLWRLGRPGGLRFDDVHPAAGSVAGLVAGGLWLGVTVLFVLSAVLLVARRRWWPVAFTAAILSLAVLVPSVSITVAGIIVDMAVICAAAIAWVPQRRTSSTVTRDRASWV